jgi:N-methylhydantoinase A
MKLAGVDVGGTFTDVVYVDTQTGEIGVHKVPSTPDDPSEGVIGGLGEAGGKAAELDLLAHGTTVATNALLQHDGAVTGLLTTKGYRDILHIARHQRPQHYSIQQDVPWQDNALVLRRHRKVVTERVGPQGEILVPLDEEEVATAAAELRDAGVESVIIGFINSYRNSEHEERSREIVEEVHPSAFVTTSASVFPQFREYERFTTAAINGFVGPKMRFYVNALTKRLADAGIAAELRLMRSNGGVVTSEVASRLPATMLLSGPAAGVLAGERIGETLERESVISFDMGGTSADIGIITPRGILEATARDTWIAGFPILIPMIDVHTVGAGGGSVAYVDPGGAFRVGPRSAGARPGPACYGFGGTEPTVTDANLVLGRLRAEHFLGGAMGVDAEQARDAIDRLRGELDLSVIEAAAGVVTLVNHNMANAIRSRTIQKGHDPRRFTLVAFGGAGPLHAAEMAKSLGIPEVIVPVHPGITSAVGLLCTDLKYDLIQNEFMLDSEVDLGKLNDDFRRLDMEATSQLHRDGIAENKIQLFHAADCRYVGQGYELKVPMPEGELNSSKIATFWNDFHKLHKDEYGHAFPGNPIELVNVRVVARGEMPKIPQFIAPEEGSVEEAFYDEAPVHFPTEGGGFEQQATRFYDRTRMPAGTSVNGPAILLELDSTVVIPPGSSAEVLSSGEVVIRI